MSVPERPVRIAIDTGTTALKIAMSDADDSLSVQAFPGISDAPDVVSALRSIIHEYDLHNADLSIRLTGQMHGTVIRSGDAYLPVIPWNATASEAVLPDLLARLGNDYPARCGGQLAAGFQAATLECIRQRHPERWASIEQVMLPKDAPVHLLTGRHVTDSMDAVSTGLVNVHTRTWDERTLRELQLDEDWLPTILPVGTSAGPVSPATAELLDHRGETDVVLVGGDAQVPAARLLDGHADRVLIMLSTGAQIIAPSRTPAADPAGNIYTWPAPGGGFFLMGRLLHAGDAMSAFRTPDEQVVDIAGAPTGMFADLSTLASGGKADGAAFTGRPGSRVADQMRATVETIGYTLRARADDMGITNVPAQVMIGGGLVRIPGVVQTLANVLGWPLTPAPHPDLTAWSALRWGDPSDSWLSDASPVQPNPAVHAEYEELYQQCRSRGMAARP